MCFHRTKNLKDFLWMKTIVDNKAQNIKLSNRKVYSIPCHSNTGKLCCKKLKHTNTFQIQPPKGHTISTTNLNARAVT